MNTKLFGVLVIVMMGSMEAAVIDVSGSLRDYAVDLKNQALDDDDAQAYVAPLQSELDDFALMAAQLALGNLAAADAIADTLDYEVVQFTDTDAGGGTYYHLREETILVGMDQKVTRGLGSYFYNPNGTKPVLLEAPHILHDTHSYDVATVSFANSGSVGMLFNGAHRDSGGAANSDAADVAHLSSSIFNTVHQTWSAGGGLQAWQFHGFDLSGSAHATIPAGTDVVLSNGDGTVSNEVKSIAMELGLVSFLGDENETIVTSYNTLDLNHADNVAINGNVDGSNMSSLGGTTNVQGIFTRNQGDIFVHIELEQSIRLDQDLTDDRANRRTAGLAIAEAIQEIPEPSTCGLISFTALGLLGRRRN
jgi:hypothetical protein